MLGHKTDDIFGQRDGASAAGLAKEAGRPKGQGWGGLGSQGAAWVAGWAEGAGWGLGKAGGAPWKTKAAPSHGRGRSLRAGQRAGEPRRAWDSGSHPGWVGRDLGGTKLKK